MLVYLNSVPDEWGGWTTFPKLQVRHATCCNVM